MLWSLSSSLSFVIVVCCRVFLSFVVVVDGVVVLLLLLLRDFGLSVLLPLHHQVYLWRR